jgi:hypothetical protein
MSAATAYLVECTAGRTAVVRQAAAGTATQARPLYRGDNRGAPLASRGHTVASRD